MPDTHDEAVAGRDVGGALGSLIAIALGSAAFWYSAEFSMLGAVFPRTIAALLILLGVVYLIMVALGRTHGSRAPRGSNLRRVALALVMLGWAFALVPLGFLLSSALAFALLMLIANHERWTPARAATTVAAGAVVLGGLYGLFKFVLLVPLP
ncbi:MAG: tripartite tricarboxylate transporter TctB family protein [Burkholderiaceae bacterium]